MNRGRPNFRDVFTNLKAPLPWPTKVHLLFRNNWLKIRNFRNCCGHLGEPGCWQRQGGPDEGCIAEPIKDWKNLFGKSKEAISMSESIQWRDNLTEAQEEAKKANRPVLLEFYLDGWPHCGRLVRETHQDPAVIKALNEDFIPVRLEGRGHMDMVQKYEVRGAPTTLLFSPDGEEKHRFVGFQGAEDYLKELKKAA